MRRRILIGVGLLVAGVLTAAFGCAAPTPTPTQAPAATSKPVATPTVTPTSTPFKPVELKMHINVDPAHLLNTKVAQPIADEIGRRTGGRVKITIYPSATLGPAREAYNLVKTGVADIAMFSADYTAGQFPLSSIIGLPFAYHTSTIGSAVWWDLFKLGHFDKEFADTKILSLMTTSPQQLLIAKGKRSPMSLADLKGMKISTTGGYTAEALSAVGIVPIVIPGADLYLAIQRGTVEGSVFPLAGMVSRKFQELASSVAILSCGGQTIGIGMNLDSWAKLPNDVQKIIIEVGEQSVLWAGKAFDEGDVEAVQVFAKAGVNVYDFPAAERTKWVQSSEAIWRRWIDDMKGKGLPGQAVFNDFVSILKKKGVDIPF